MPPTPTPVIRRVPILGHIQPVPTTTSQGFFASTARQSLFATSSLPKLNAELAITKDSFLEKDETPVMRLLPPMLKKVPSGKELLSMNKTLLRSEVTLSTAENTITDLAAGLRRAIQREK